MLSLYNACISVQVFPKSIVRVLGQVVKWVKRDLKGAFPRYFLVDVVIETNAYSRFEYHVFDQQINGSGRSIGLYF
jgi:hypothetical protein